MIKILSFALLLSVMVNPCLAQSPLKGLKAQQQALLLFSKSRSDAGLDKQVDLLRDYRPDLRSRNVVVLRTSGHEETRTAIGYTAVDRGTARKLRNLYKPAKRGLTVVLVDNQGIEKTRWLRLVQPQEVFDVIDADTGSEPNSEAAKTN